MRQDWNRNADARVRLGRPGVIQCERVLGRQQSRVGKERHQPERFPAGGAGNLFHSGREQRWIAAKLVDEKSADQGGVGRIDHRLRPDEARDHPAAVNVADQNYRHLRGPGKAHVGNVVRAQIDFRCAAGALDQDQVRLERAVGRSFPTQV